MNIAKSYNNFIQIARTKYDNKYCYHSNTYRTKETKMVIECIKHEYIFIQSPKNHLKYEGCKYCRIEKKRLKSYNTFLVNTTEKNKNYNTYKNKCKQIFKNIYDYTNTYYINDEIEINVICKIHGSFEIFPQLHLFGFGCEKCEHLVLHDN